MIIINNKKRLNKNIKAGVWYTASNFINKGIAYLSTPIFTRMMTKDEFGDFNNFVSWGTLLLIITSLDLYSSINRAYFDYKDEFDEYMSTISGVSVFFTAFCYLVVWIWKDTFVSIFGMNFRYINIMFLYLLFYPAYNFFMTQQRITGRYKLFSITSITSSILSMLLSVILVWKLEDRLSGRIWGYVLPVIMVNLVLYGIFFYKGKRIVRDKIKYALFISIPLIPHHISGSILNSSDRVMIKKFCGSEDTALYSLAYSCSMLVSLLNTSINQAYVPWLYEKLTHNNLKNVRKISEYILLGFLGITLGLLMFGPELILILGGEKYTKTIDVIPFVMLGCCFQFVYTFYVNIEFYCKKTFMVSIGTVVAASVNIILNLVLIPRFGYIAAAFTTLIGYIILYVIHYSATKKMDFAGLYDNKKILSYMLLFSIVCILMYPIYMFPMIRRLLLAFYLLLVIIAVIIGYKKIRG